MERTLPMVSARMSFLDWPTPDGIAVVVYIAGCEHNCDGCHSPELQDDSKFMPVGISDAVNLIVRLAKDNRTFNVVLSGGDPLYHHEEVQNLIDELILKDDRFAFCIYTGFEFDEASSLIKGYKFMKTGMYDKSKHQMSEKTDRKMVLASKNQKFYDECGNCLTVCGVLRFS